MAKKKIKVLHVILSLETGGMERFVYEHCLAIDKSKVDVSVCCIDRLEGFSDALIAQGIRVELLQKNQQRFDYFFPFRLSRYLKKNQVDVVHIHSGAFFHGSVAGFLARTPAIIYTEHGRDQVEPPVLYYLDKISTFCAHRIVTVSQDLETYMIQQRDLPARKIQTIINGVNTDDYRPRTKPTAILRELAVDDECRIIGTVGRLAEVKNQAMLIRAFSLLHAAQKNVRLVLVGGGGLETALKALVKDLSLEDAVFFAGDRGNVEEWLNAMDVFVLSSFSEGTSMSLLEAMASGVTPIVTDVGGNPDIVEHGVNGFVVNVDDDKALAERMADALDSANKDMAIKARELVKSRFSLKSNLDQYVKLYGELCDA